MLIYKRRFSSIALILAVFFVTSNLVMFNFVALNKEYTINAYKPVIKTSDLSTSCQSAIELNLINLEQAGRFAENSHPNCSDQDWIRITDEGVVLYDIEYLKSKDISIKSCEYQTVKWKDDDFSYELESPILIRNGSKLDLNKEFFIVNCQPENGWSNYQSVFARLFNQSDLIKSKEKQPINVFILGLDSVSRQTWLENLPKSSYFLINDLKSEVLERFNIVGDGTPANLIPLLTSWHEHELPNTIKNTNNSTFVDLAYPFIWKEFASKLNYATLYGEDWPNIGTFQYRMKGFSKPPTLHYMRPFHLAIDNIISKSPPCSKGRTNFKVNIDYVKDFMNAYKSRGFFGWLFLNEYSHDSNDHLKWLDFEIYDFLNFFHQHKSISDNTVLILFSDHGARFSDIRKSIKGLLQERNPFMSVYLPQLFRQRYPNEFLEFKKNVHKLITPMDVQQTLMHLLKLEANEPIDTDEQNARAISVFKKRNFSRTCGQAGIDSHWCACLRRYELKIDSVLNDMAKLFVAYLNEEILKNSLDKCVKLELKNVTRVHLLESSIDIEYTNKRSSNFDFLSNLNLLRAPPIEQGYQKFLFQISTKPNDGFYEFTIEIENNFKDHKSYLNKIKINRDKISRLDKYGNSSSCIFNTFPDLRKYCYCKENF